MRFFRAIFSFLGINEAIFYSLILRGWQIVAAPITLFLIIHHFSPEQQGFYYTFNSLLLLQIFFEMGLSFVLIQFSSHEFSKLSWKKMGGIQGAKRLRRFKEILNQSMHYYSLFSLLFFVLLVPAGFYFLASKSSENVNFDWKLPWVISVLFTTLILLATPLMAIIEGSGRVKEVSLVRLGQSITSVFAAWIVIALGGGLLNAATITSVNAIFIWVWLVLKNPSLVRLALRGILKSQSLTLTSTQFSWRQEIWPMQWRIALSWVSGYFINQLFVPILFYYHGPEIAGKMGMTLSLANMLPIVGQAWITSKAPFMGRLVAQRELEKFDEMFFKLLKQSTVVVFLGACTLAIFPFVFSSVSIFQRVLSPDQIAILAASSLVTHLVNCFAQYLRSFKKEPMMEVSVIGAILVASLAWYSGKYYSSKEIVFSAFAVNLLFGLPTSFWLWLKHRKTWKNELA